MLRKLFRKLTTTDDLSAQKAATFDAAVAKASAADPLVAVRIGAEELVQAVFREMETEQGVHIESVLGVLGSLAGFCCVDSTLKQAVALGKETRECGIVDVETSDGQRFFTGGPINQLLAESERSLWALVAGMINHLGGDAYPDAGEIAGHVAGTFGKDDFGIPRVPDNHRPHDIPLNYVRALWPVMLPLIEKRAPALQDRVVLFGLAIQNVIKMAKDIIPPPMAGKLVMECAVPMSRIDPSRI